MREWGHARDRKVGKTKATRNSSSSQGRPKTILFVNHLFRKIASSIPSDRPTRTIRGSLLRHYLGIWVLNMYSIPPCRDEIRKGHMDIHTSKEINQSIELQVFWTHWFLQWYDRLLSFISRHRLPHICSVQSRAEGKKIQ